MRSRAREAGQDEPEQKDSPGVSAFGYDSQDYPFYGKDGEDSHNMRNGKATGLLLEPGLNFPPSIAEEFSIKGKW